MNEVIELGADVRAELRSVGADLDSPQNLLFYFYFPTQAAARAAAADLQGEGFACDVDRGAQGSDWLCLASRRMLPDEATLNRLGPRFEAVAATHGGEYDGWEAELVA